MAIGPGLWWLVFYHTKCFLALKNGPAVREGYNKWCMTAAVRVVKHGTFGIFWFIIFQNCAGNGVLEGFSNAQARSPGNLRCFC